MKPRKDFEPQRATRSSIDRAIARAEQPKTEKSFVERIGEHIKRQNALKEKR